MKQVLAIARWIPALCIVCVSWYLSSQERIEQMPNFWNADKLIHCVCFAGLAFWVACGAGGKASVRVRFILPAVLASCYGIVDEIHQYFTPGRTASVFDWLADSIGGVSGSIIFFYGAQFFIRRCLQNLSSSH